MTEVFLARLDTARRNWKQNINHHLRRWLEKQLLPDINFALENSDEPRFVISANSFCVANSFCDAKTAARSEENNYFVDLAREANGTVFALEHTGPRILVQPPCNALGNSDFRNEDIEQHLRDDKYDIYPVLDATVLGIYYWKNKWCISTRKCWLANNIKWRNITYERALLDVIGDFSSFNTEHNYVIAMHHHAMHPFQTENYIRVLQCSQPEFTAYSYYEPLDIDWQSDYRISELRSDCDHALENWIKTSHVNLGYVLISRDALRTQQFSRIIMFSTLFAEIKRSVYTPPRVPRHMQDKIHMLFADIDYVVAYNWLNITRNRLFFTMFPQFTEHRIRLEEYLQVLVNAVIAREPGDIDMDIYSRACNIVEANYKSKIPRNNFKNRNSKKQIEKDQHVVHDILRNVKNVELFLTV